MQATFQIPNGETVPADSVFLSCGFGPENKFGDPTDRYYVYDRDNPFGDPLGHFDDDTGLPHGELEYATYDMLEEGTGLLDVEQAKQLALARWS